MDASLGEFGVYDLNIMEGNVCQWQEALQPGVITNTMTRTWKEFQKQKSCVNSMIINRTYIFFASAAQWIQGFFNHFVSTAHAIGGKLLLKYPPTTFVKAKS